MPKKFIVFCFLVLLIVLAVVIKPGKVSASNCCAPGEASCEVGPCSTDSQCAAWNEGDPGGWHCKRETICADTICGGCGVRITRTFCDKSSNVTATSPSPTSTPTPTPARPSLCQSATVSKNTLRPGESLTITSTAKSWNIKSFTYGFYNLDNLYGPGNPKPIYFTANTHYVVSKAVATPTNTYTLTVPFSDLDKPDLNWNSQKPVKIQVNAYFTNTEDQLSAPEAACVVTFTLTASEPTATTAPTATSVPGCDCSSTANTCAAVCPVNQATNKFSDITYTEPVKCSLTSTINVPTPATSQEKTNWCNRPLRTKGDADGNGAVNDLDYIYYMRAVMRAPLPGSINPDFNGDGDVTTADLVIWQHAR